MAIDTTKKKKPAVAPVGPPPKLVPPPAPYTPTLLAQVPQLAQGLAMPQSFAPSPVTAGQPAGAPAQAPNMVSLSQFLPYLQPNPEDVKALQATRDKQSALAQSAQSQADNVDSQFLPMPTKVANTQFENFLQQTTQQQIMKELSGGHSALDRFEKGQQIGQRIAASIVVPLMGVLGKAPGTAAGANAAVQDINNQVAASRASELADRVHRNNAVMGLSQLYEKLSPDSAANVTKLLAQQIETAKFNQSLKKDAVNQQQQTLKDLSSTQEKLLSTSNAAGQHLVNTALQLQGQGIQVAGQQQADRHFAATAAATAADRANNLDLQKQRVGIEQANLDQRKADLAYRQEHDSTEDGRKDAAQQLAATQAFERSIRLNAQDAMGTKADGSPKYKGYADFLKQNPAINHITEQLAAKAGIPKSDIGGIFDSLTKQGAPTPGNNDWGGLVDGAKSALTSILGNGATAPSAPPPKQAAPAAPVSQSDAAAKLLESKGYKKVNGQWVKK